MAFLSRFRQFSLCNSSLSCHMYSLYLAIQPKALVCLLHPMHKIADQAKNPQGRIFLLSIFLRKLKGLYFQKKIGNTGGKKHNNYTEYKSESQSFWILIFIDWFRFRKTSVSRSFQNKRLPRSNSELDSPLRPIFTCKGVTMLAFIRTDTP